MEKFGNGWSRERKKIFLVVLSCIRNGTKMKGINQGVDAVGGEGRGGMWGFIKGPGTWGQTKVNL